MKIWQRGLIIFLCMTTMLCSMALIPPKNEITASALGAYTLTVEQTLALYGRRLQGTFYNKNDGIDYHVEFTYCFPLSNWKPSDYENHAVYIYNLDAAVNADGDSGASIKTAMEQKNWLVYTMLDNASAYPYPTYSGSTDHSNLYVEMPFSINLDGIYMWDQFFMWGTWYANENYPSERSMITNVTSMDAALTCKPYYYYYASNWYHRMSQATFPGYQPVSVSAVPNNEAQLIYCSVIRNKMASVDDNGFSISSQNARYNWVHAYSMTNWGNGIGSTAGVGEKNIVIFIQCPTFSTSNPLPDFNGTTADAGTGTIPYETFPPVDLSGLESGVGTLVNQQEINNYYQWKQLDALNRIIQQLNAIYARMAENGEVPVSLEAADSYPTLNSSVLQDIDSLTTYTMAQLPTSAQGVHLNAGTSMLFRILQPFSDMPWLFGIGLFSLSFSILCWVIFRGRG